MTAIKTISRIEAIRRVAEYQLKRLNPETRLGYLEMLRLEWSPSQLDESYLPEGEDAEYDLRYQAEVSETVRRDIDTAQYGDVMRSRYDSALIIYLAFEMRAESHIYLLRMLTQMGYSADHIEGEAPDRVGCPCCGANTLTERHGWDICPVCWWEDDGTDNDEASLYFSGPNKGLQLTAARINFILTGIYNPERVDLIEKKASIEDYERSRIFKIDAERGIIFENGTDWYAPLKPPHLKEGEANPRVSLAGVGLRDWPPDV